MVVALVTVLALTISFGQVIFAVSYFLQSPAQQRGIDSIGSYVGGTAAMLGFVWVIAGFWVQSRELLLQRHELLLQRQAIERSAAAAQIEIALALRGAYLRRLGETAKYVAQALYNAEERNDAETALSSTGNPEAFINWLLRRGDLDTRLHKALQDDLIVASFVKRYVEYDAQFLEIVQQTEIEHRLVSDTLKVDAPSILARAFKAAAEKANV